MAGTTVDEDNLVYKLMHETILSDGYECSLSMVLAVGAGKEKKDAFREVLLELGVFAPDNIAKRLNEKFQQNLFDAYLKANVKSMPGAEAVFKQLRQNEILVVLNTGYHATIAKLLLDKLNWKVGEEIDLLVTASDVNKGRPSPDTGLVPCRLELSKHSSQSGRRSIFRSDCSVRRIRSAEVSLPVALAACRFFWSR